MTVSYCIPRTLIPSQRLQRLRFYNTQKTKLHPLWNRSFSSARWPFLLGYRHVIPQRLVAFNSCATTELVNVMKVSALLRRISSWCSILENTAAVFHSCVKTSGHYSWRWDPLWKMSVCFIFLSIQWKSMSSIDKSLTFIVWSKIKNIKKPYLPSWLISVH